MQKSDGDPLQDALTAAEAAGLLSGDADAMFDRFTRLAVAVLNVPLAQLNVVTADRQFTKSSGGDASEDFAQEVALSHSYCQYVVAGNEALWITDARQDPVLCSNGATTEGGIVAYAGVPLRIDEGPPVATLCAVDFVPRGWGEDERTALRDVAAAVAAEVRLRLELAQRQRAEASLRESRDRIEILNRDLERRVEERTAELQKAHDQLRQAQKMEAIGRLASGVAHDFNNVLTIIAGNCRLALDDLPEASPAGEALEEIDAAVKHASSITGQLLALSRQGQMDPREMSLPSLITSIKRMLEQAIAPCRLVLSRGAGDGIVFVDANRMTQVMLNLAANARDAMNERGVLTVTTDVHLVDEPLHGFVHRVPPGRYGRILVQDSGSGMSAEQLQHALEPFYTTKATGTGLGLSTSYGIVKQAGGYFGMQSSEGAGTTVQILLPLVEAPSSGSSPIRESPQEESLSSNP